MSTEVNIENILSAYADFGELKSCKPIVAGHINDTYVAEYDKDGETVRYLLQRINTNVFKNPDELMQNVVGVTSFLKKKIAAAGGDTERETLTVFYTKDGKSYHKDKDGNSWRVYNYIENAYSLDEISDPDVFKDAAISFGNFQKLLADYPIESLYDTIPNFHNTPVRFENFKKSLENNASGRKDTAIDEINFVLEREKDCSVVTELIESGEIPVRVTHNDTKLNNVLFDNNTHKGVCIVDLDTVMPGSPLYDFGDSIRFGANTAAEDEKDISKVSLSLDYFKAYTEGYLSTARDTLNETEKMLLPFSAKLLTLECGMRFLGDYLDGDVYFKTAYPEHNLVRARTQLALVADIERKLEEMKKIVSEC